MIRRSTWRPLAGPGPARLARRPGQTAVISAWANCGDGAGGGGGGLRRRIAVFTSAFLSLSARLVATSRGERGSRLLPDFLLVGSGRILHNTAIQR